MNKDFVRELAAAIDAQLLFSNWRLYALTLALLLVSKGFDVYLAHYWAKRAEVKAAGADLHEVIRQLKATTMAAEAVRAEILKADWLDKEWRSIRRVKLEELLCAANGMLASLGFKTISEAEAPTNDDGDRLKMLCALYFPELRDEVTHVYTTFKLYRIHILESQTAMSNALDDHEAERVIDDFQLKRKALYSMFVQAQFTLEKAAADLMQVISQEEKSS